MELPRIRRMVVKVGTSTLTYDNGKPNLRRMERLVRTISDLMNSGIEIVLVSSGAIAVGVQGLNLPHKPKDTPTRQAAAAVGQCDLMTLYDRMFSEYGRKAAQILLTLDVVEQEERKRNVINTFCALLNLGAVPIVNENDTVSVEELVAGEEGGKLSFGDNDFLSALVATLVQADTLVILTDIDGLYDDNPRENPYAKRIAVVEKVTPELLEIAGDSGTNRGTGGMRTKLDAARLASEHGIHTWIVSGERPQILYDITEGKNVGTQFLPTGERPAEELC